MAIVLVEDDDVAAGVQKNRDDIGCVVEEHVDAIDEIFVEARVDERFGLPNLIALNQKSRPPTVAVFVPPVGPEGLGVGTTKGGACQAGLD